MQERFQRPPFTSAGSKESPHPPSAFILSQCHRGRNSFSSSDADSASNSSAPLRNRCNAITQPSHNSCPSILCHPLGRLTAINPPVSFVCCLCILQRPQVQMISTLTRLFLSTR